MLYCIAFRMRATSSGDFSVSCTVSATAAAVFSALTCHTTDALRPGYCNIWSLQLAVQNPPRLFDGAEAWALRELRFVCGLNLNSYLQQRSLKVLRIDQRHCETPLGGSQHPFPPAESHSMYCISSNSGYVASQELA